MAGKNEWYDHGTSLVSCALAGAASMISGITDSYTIANGPAWCYFYAMRAAESPHLKLGQRFRCTYPGNDAVVFGMEKEVKRALATLKEGKDLPVKPGVILLENSCSLSLIGDDLQGFAADMDMSCPVIVIDSGGIAGDYWAGYNKALLALLKITPYKDVETKEKTVNIIGCSPGYYQEIDDLEEISSLLEKMGLKVHLTIGMNHTMEELSTLRKASLNIVLHPELGEKAAQYLEKKFNIPYIMPTMPYGIKGTLQWAKDIAIKMAEIEEANDIASYMSNLEKEAETMRIHQYETLKEMQRLWGEPWFEQVLMAGPSSIVKGMAAVCAEEWFDTANIVLVCHDAEESTEAYYSVKDERWITAIEPMERTLLLSSNHEKMLFQEKVLPLAGSQTISKPVEDDVVLSKRPFMGFKGHYAMLERIWRMYIDEVQRGNLNE